MVHAHPLGGCRPGPVESSTADGFSTARRQRGASWICDLAIVTKCLPSLQRPVTETSPRSVTTERGPGAHLPCECRRTEGLKPLTLGAHLPA
jgi:hypothetical protein